MRRCPHRRTVVVTTGGYHYSAGQVWDDITEERYCVTCGKQVTHGWWNWKERVKRYYRIPQSENTEIEVPF